MSTVEAIKNFFLHTGAAWVLWLLFALSFISIAIVIERVIVFRTKGTDLKRLADKLDIDLMAAAPRLSPSADRVTAAVYPP